jgi:hypothetical protein
VTYRPTRSHTPEHRIESTSVLGDAGAGTQVSPNTTRLHLWGRGSALAAVAVEPASIGFRRYDTVRVPAWYTRVEAPAWLSFTVRRTSTDQIITPCSSVLHAQPQAQRCCARRAAGRPPRFRRARFFHADVKGTSHKAVTGLDDVPMPTGDGALLGGHQH